MNMNNPSDNPLLAAAAAMQNAPFDPSEPLRLEYFGGLYGRADPLVQMFKKAGANFEYVEVQPVQWAGMKHADGEFACLPRISQGGQVS